MKILNKATWKAVWADFEFQFKRAARRDRCVDWEGKGGEQSMLRRALRNQGIVFTRSVWRRINKDFAEWFDNYHLGYPSWDKQQRWLERAIENAVGARSAANQAATLTAAADNVADRFWAQYDMKRHDVPDAVVFGFLMGTIHGAVLHDVLNHQELRKTVYQVFRDRLHYTDEDIAIDIIGG